MSTATFPPAARTSRCYREDVRPSYRRRRAGPPPPAPRTRYTGITQQPTWFRGRGWAGHYQDTDHLARTAEMDRQAWVYEITSMEAEFIAVDPDKEYQRHRAAYEATGDTAELQRALEYVRAEP